MHEHYDDDHIRKIMDTVKTVAIVGASWREDRPSMFVTKYLADRGYRVYPINPGHAGKEINGNKIYAHLSDVPEPIDMVDVFRASDAIPKVLEEVLALSPLPKVFWMQLGIRNDAAAEKAEAAGMTVIMDRCPKIEYGRLSREIGWVGVNTRTLSSKRPKLREGGVQKLRLGPGNKPG